MADVFPYGVYSTKRNMIIHIGLYESEARCWEVYLGWPSEEEIEWFKEHEGLKVVPVTVSYDPTSLK